MNTAEKSGHILPTTTQGDDLKQLENTVEVFLMQLNRHDRRAWLAKRNRVAGKARDKALTVRKGM